MQRTKLGMDAAKELWEMGIGCHIIFLTISREYALELFHVLDRVWKKTEEDRRKYLVMRIGTSVCRIPMQNILYVEAQKKVSVSV